MVDDDDDDVGDNNFMNKEEIDESSSDDQEECNIKLYMGRTPKLEEIMVDDAVRFVFLIIYLSFYTCRPYIIYYLY